MTSSVDIENRPQIARTTCGWRKPGLDRDAVRSYWRDVHSPAIARRADVHWYRHSPFDEVRPDLFAPIVGVDYTCARDEQLMWQSDVVYLDEGAVAGFMRSPSDPEVTALLLQDIEMIVDKSTTYKAVGDNLLTYVDRTGEPVPMGPRAHPTYAVFFRQAGDQEPFRELLRALATRWAATPGVVRVRMNLFDVPDMEAERKAGYPVKTHPAELQYQAWIELVVASDDVAHGLLTDRDGVDYASHMSAVHAYPVPAMYTFVYDGRPTIIGLRGYAGHVAIEGLGATHAADDRLLEWLYGPVVHGGGVREA